MSEPLESLDSILDRLRAGVDPDTKQPHITWDEAKAKLERLIQTSNREARVDENEFWERQIEVRKLMKSPNKYIDPLDLRVRIKKLTNQEKGTDG